VRRPEGRGKRRVMVVLGVPGAYIDTDTAAGACDSFTTKVGGLPFWPRGVSAPRDKAFTACSVCQKEQLLVLQAYSPLPTSPDRAIYVFACTSPACKNKQGSWRAICAQSVQRASCTEAQAALPSSQPDSCRPEPWQEPVDNWGAADAENWNGEDVGQVQAEDPDLDSMLAHIEGQMNGILVGEASSRVHSTEDTTTGDRSRCWPAAEPLARPAGSASQERTSSPSLASFYICAKHEDVNRKSATDKKVQELLEEYARNEEGESDAQPRSTHTSKKGAATVSARQEEKYAPEEYEEGDQKSLVKFHEKVGMCPQQCVRYQYGGDPLWPCDASCGRRIVETYLDGRSAGSRSGVTHQYAFELQLMPQLLFYITSEDEVGGYDHCSWQSSLSGVWDWGSVLIYTRGNRGYKDQESGLTWEVDGVVFMEEAAVLLPLGDETNTLVLGRRTCPDRDLQE